MEKTFKDTMEDVRVRVLEEYPGIKAHFLSSESYSSITWFDGPNIVEMRKSITSVQEVKKFVEEGKINFRRQETRRFMAAVHTKNLCEGQYQEVYDWLEKLTPAGLEYLKTRQQTVDVTSNDLVRVKHLTTVRFRKVFIINQKQKDLPERELSAFWDLHETRLLEKLYETYYENGTTPEKLDGEITWLFTKAFPLVKLALQP